MADDKCVEKIASKPSDLSNGSEKLEKTAIFTECLLSRIILLESEIVRLKESKPGMAVVRAEIRDPAAGNCVQYENYSKSTHICRIPWNSPFSNIWGASIGGIYNVTSGKPEAIATLHAVTQNTIEIWLSQPQTPNWNDTKYFKWDVEINVFGGSDKQQPKYLNAGPPFTPNE